ncbi:MAG: hypothetical protein DRP75_01080 [Candidatus Omnitrophota bacterium]|nr:MAG: hypothetical protein DRP75_01080 [Candidatus Omnitrophota bacterium]
MLTDRLIITSICMSFLFSSLSFAQEEKEMIPKEQGEISLPYSSPSPPGEKEARVLEISKLPEEGYYSMELRDIELQDLLRVLSRDYKLNIVLSDEVKGRITASFNRITLKQALDAILKIKGYTFKEEEGIIKVIKEPKIRKFFPLFYISAEQIKDSLSELKSSEGKIIIDDRSNTIMVIDLPENVRKIEEFIYMVDVKQPQVLIEAEILETTVGALEEIGTKWASTIVSYTAPSRSTSFPLHGFIIAGKKEPTFELGNLTILPPGEEASILLRMLASHSHTRFLAKPRICVLNGEEANIDISTDAVVSVKETVETTETGSITSTQAERRKIGTTLTVTPTVDKEGFITLKIKPTVSTAADSRFTGYIDPQERSLETVLRVKDGQTLVMGGLISKTTKESVNKVPFFGDIPFFGGLFRYKQENEEENELLIFITPHIVSDTSSEQEKESGVLDKEQKKEGEEERGKIINSLPEYQRYISQKIRRYAHLHPPAKERGEGEVSVEFIVLPNGSLKQIPEIVFSSNEDLNDWAIDCVINASPFFPFDIQSSLPESERRFKITLYYRPHQF